MFIAYEAAIFFELSDYEPLSCRMVDDETGYEAREKAP